MLQFKIIEKRKRKIQFQYTIYQLIRLQLLNQLIISNWFIFSQNKCSLMLQLKKKKMFTEDKKQNLRNQISFYQQGVPRNINMNKESHFIIFFKKTFYNLILLTKAETLVNKDLNRSISLIETISGNIKMMEQILSLIGQLINKTLLILS
ncbi:unnamed protein product [Paramecium sonneborni]|uniref:Uncharacterized protein n=1 Tax=Paramecium sonneborni TaxID=65129 RepID=A0A8S1L7C2_9CILI|nr:unnamed protein product [Paramecium sonneborni]